MKHIELSNGFTADIDEKVLDDMRLFDALADAESGNDLALPRVMKLILGGYKDAFYASCADDDGRVPLESIKPAFNELCEQLKAVKK